MPFGLLALVVVASGGVVRDLRDGRDVERMVELTVAAIVEPMPRVRSRRRVQRCGRVVAGVAGPGREPGDVAGVADQIAATIGPTP